jgi:hypothetical protein
MVAETRPSIYLDLESAQDRAKLSDPELYFAQHPDELIASERCSRAFLAITSASLSTSRRSASTVR